MFSGFVKQLQDTNSGILHVHDLKQTLQSKGLNWILTAETTTSVIRKRHPKL